MFATVGVLASAAAPVLAPASAPLVTAASDSPPALTPLPLTAAVWGISILLIVVMYVVDFIRTARNPHAVGMREASIAIGVFVSFAVVFGLIFYAWASAQPELTHGEAVEHTVAYYAGYITELSLSVDNVFVFLVIMSSFAVPPIHQMKVLQLGVIGALILRFIFILVAGAALAAFSWLFYFFGAFLIWTAIKLVTSHGVEADPTENKILKFVERLVPTTTEYHGSAFVVVLKGVRTVTPLFIVMCAIFMTDIMFALDSIPAIFGLTYEPYIVFMANAFALMGLRQLYFVLDGMRDRLVYLTQGLALVLGFIGVKLVITALYSGEWIDFHISTYASLAFIVVVLAITVIASLIKGPKKPTPTESELAGHHRKEGAGLEDIVHEQEKRHHPGEGH